MVDETPTEAMLSGGTPKLVRLLDTFLTRIEALESGGGGGGGPPTGAAGGDLSGTYPNPVIDPTISDLFLTADEKAALDGANAPDGANPFATMADVGGPPFDPLAVPSDLLPDTDATYNVGSAALRWAEGYLSQLLQVGGAIGVAGGVILEPGVVSVQDPNGLTVANVGIDVFGYGFLAFPNATPVPTVGQIRLNQSNVPLIAARNVADDDDIVVFSMTGDELAFGSGSNPPFGMTFSTRSYMNLGIKEPGENPATISDISFSDEPGFDRFLVVQLGYDPKGSKLTFQDDGDAVQFMVDLGPLSGRVATLLVSGDAGSEGIQLIVPGGNGENFSMGPYVGASGGILIDPTTGHPLLIESLPSSDPDVEKQVFTFASSSGIGATVLADLAAALAGGQKLLLQSVGP